jgi:hypothetical protein
VENDQLGPEDGTALTAKLSLEISQFVSRALRGEAVDTADEGAKLAARFPQLGMSGEMIGSAIARAIGMVGAIRDGAGAAEMAPAASAEASGETDPIAAEEPDGAAAAPVVHSMPSAPDLTEFLTPTNAILLQDAPDTPPQDSPVESDIDNVQLAAPKAASGAATRFTKGPVAAVRRAFFRH